MDAKGTCDLFIMFFDSGVQVDDRVSLSGHNWANLFATFV